MQLDIQSSNYDALKSFRQSIEFSKDAYYANQEAISYVEDPEIRYKMEKLRNTRRDLLNLSEALAIELATKVVKEDRSIAVTADPPEPIAA